MKNWKPRLKHECDNCEARNSRVRPYDLKRKGLKFRTLWLCEDCAEVARRLAAVAEKSKG
jgi:hypothetical protein